jgi:hypothetical protein
MPAPPPSAAERAVLIHGPRDARLAFSVAADLGVPLLLLSEPGAAAHAGSGWFRELVANAAAAHPGVAHAAVLDCGERAGDAQGALADGIACILFTGRPDVAARLADVAAQKDALVLTERPPALDLRGRPGAALVCRAWLSGMTVPDP